MAAFRILNQFPVYLGLSNLPADGGELRFYESGTTDPKSVYADPGLTIDNGPTVGIGSDGRTEVDVWGEGAYRVRLYEADGTLVAEADDVEIAGGDATTIPALVDGYFLTNNGSLLLWAQLLQLPDPIGQDGKMVVADGASYILVPQPTPPVPVEPEIVRTGNGAAGSFRAGTSASTTKHFEQWGQATAPANAGAKTTSLAVVYPVAFVDTPRIFITMRGSGFTNAGSYPDFGLSADSATGFTVKFDSQRGESNSDMNLSSAIPFSWHALGTVVVEPEEEP